MFSEDSGCFPFMERVKKHREKSPRKEFIFGAEPPDPYRKTVLLIGPKSSGKTALVNSFANLVNNVTDNSPYRLHITPVKETAPSNSTMNYAPTLTVSSYVFQHSPLGFPVALVDTPSLGLVPELSSQLPNPAVQQIKTWITNDYTKPIEDLEIWLVISAVDSDATFLAEPELQDILDLLKWKTHIMPVITFAKRRNPVLALKALAQLGFRCEREGVDFFTVNNGSVLGLSNDILEVNALTFTESLQHLSQLILANREPVLMPLHVATSPGKSSSLKNSETSSSSPSISSPSSDDVHHSSEGSLPEEPLHPPPDLFRGGRGTSERPLTLPTGPPPLHTRFRSYETAIIGFSNGPLRQQHDHHNIPQRDALPPRHQRMRSHDSVVPSKLPPRYERITRNELPGSNRNSPCPQKPLAAHKRCKSEDDTGVVRRKFGFVSISPYETLV